MTDPALLAPYDISHRLVTKTLTGLSRERLLAIAVRVPPARTEEQFGAVDALADLLRPGVAFAGGVDLLREVGR